MFSGEGFIHEYEGEHLKEDLYKNIIFKWILAMNERVDIKIEDINKIFRVKCDAYDPFRDEFIIETNDEYILFLWATLA